ncbi:MAG: Ig-like domain repeat protein, partial [Acidobacteria bacterium]|nr:Ig-like domain repeat protein [Acidobacteriota bacterium]
MSSVASGTLLTFTGDGATTATTTSLASSANPSVFGQNVDFTATVTAGASSVTTGSVTFRVDGTAVATVGLNETGQAVYSTSSLAVGSHAITATYNGTSSFGTSTGTLSPAQTVNRADTTVDLFSNLNPSVFGQAVTFTAVVNPVAPGAGSRTGTVQFQDNGVNIGSPVAVSAATASFTVSSLSAGPHTITAIYSGDGNFNGSSASLVQAVSTATTTTAVTSSANPSVFGQDVTFAATVTGAGSSGLSAIRLEWLGTCGADTLKFYLNGVEIASVNANGGSCICSVPIASTTTTNPAHLAEFSAGGANTFRVVKSGTGTAFAWARVVLAAADGSQFVRPIYDVNGGDATELNLCAASYTFGTFDQSSTHTIPELAGGVSGGMVTFKEGTTVLAGPLALSAGQASFSTSTLSAGNHTITAEYSGSANFNPSSGSVAQVVNKADQSITFGVQSTQWTFKASLPAPQTSPAYAALNGLIYAAGGWDAAHLCSYLNLFTEYNPATNTWSSRREMPTPREGARAGVWDGKVYVVGGSIGCGNPPTYRTGANEAYDPATNTWSTRAPMPTARSSHGVGVVNGVLYAVGGDGGKLVEAYDIGANTWSAKAPMLVSRAGPAVAAANGKLYVLGGLDYSAGGVVTNSVETYDPGTNTWSLRTPMPSGRFGAAAVTANGRIYVIGGSGAGLLASVLAYDPVADQWSEMPALNTARTTPGAAAVNDVLYAFAGYNGDAYTPSSHFTTTEALDVAGALPDRTFGDPDFVVTATASSGLPVSFSAAGQCTVAGTTVHLTGAGSCTITASQGGNAGFNAAPDVVRSFAIAQANTTTTLTSTPNPSLYGQSVTFTATVSSSAGTPAGTVTFKDGANTLGTASLISGVFTFSTSSLSVGTHSITAEYGGDANYTAGTSAAVTQTVNKADTFTSVTATPNPSTYGQSVTFTATVAGSAVTEGTVTFREGATVLAGPLALNAVGQASFSTATLSAGSHTITAEYSGSANYNPSTGTVSQTVNKANTQTALALTGAAVTGGTWSATGSMATGRSSHTATRLLNGKVLVAGGHASGGPTASAALYDPATGTWTPTGSMAGVRGGHIAVLLNNGKVLVAGGVTNTATVNTAEVYDPATGLWSTTAGMSVNRVHHEALLLPNGKVLVAGGHDVIPGCCYNGFWSTAEVYDPPTGAWSATGSMAYIRMQGHRLTLLQTGKVLVSGGHASPGGGCCVDTATAELYDPTAGTWSNTGSMSVARQQHSATLLSNGKVLAAAGHSTSAAVLSADLYDPATGTWSATGSLAVPRYAHTATLLSGNAVLVAGGTGSSGSVASVELYDTATGTWTSTNSMTAARHAHTATLLAANQILVAGGHDAGTNLPSAELFTPSTTSTYGQTVTLMATVTGSVVAEGTVTFKDGGTALGDSVALDGSGQATITVADLAIGSHSLTAEYSGSSNFHASSASVAHTVTKADSTTAVASTPNPSTYGNSMTFTATVSGDPAAGMPTGTVTFKEGLTVLAAGIALDGSGQASFSTAALTAGSHTITADYSGGTNFNPSSGSIMQAVNRVAITVTADAQSKTYGDADPALTYQVTSGSLVAGDSFSGALARTAGNDVGSYAITQGTLALSGNYQLTFVGANLTITARPVT